jgi:hypothetical protein
LLRSASGAGETIEQIFQGSPEALEERDRTRSANRAEPMRDAGCGRLAETRAR